MGALATTRRAEIARQSISPQRSKPEHMAAHTIDGRIVLVDTSAFKFDGYTDAVVIRIDETIGIEKPVPYGPGLFNRGPRASAYGVGRLPDGRFKAINPCTVIGRVIEVQ